MLRQPVGRQHVRILRVADRRQLVVVPLPVLEDGAVVPVPVDVLLALRAGRAVGLGRGTVVHDPAVGRPGEAPAEVRTGLVVRVGLTAGGAVLVGRGVDAAVYPRGRGCAPVVLQRR